MQRQFDSFAVRFSFVFYSIIHDLNFVVDASECFYKCLFIITESNIIEQSHERWTPAVVLPWGEIVLVIRVTFWYLINHDDIKTLSSFKNKSVIEDDAQERSIDFIYKGQCTNLSYVQIFV